MRFKPMQKHLNKFFVIEVPTDNAKFYQRMKLLSFLSVNT